MKKVLLGLSLLSSIISFSQTIFWDFTGLAPTSIITSDLVVSNLSRGNNSGTTTLLSSESASSGYSGSSGGNNAAASARFGSLNTGDLGSTYFEFTLTPAPGEVVKLHSISFGSRSTTTGPVSYSLRSSLDAYASDIITGTFSNNSVWAYFLHTSLVVQSNPGTAITFRLYGYDGAGNNPPLGVANWRIDDLSLTATVADLSALPVNFESVRASQTLSGIDLKWSNLTETEIAEYKLERSSNGKDFITVQQFNALKNDDSKAEYQWTDPNPMSGDNFYRIKAVEKSGTTICSTIIRINTSGDETLFHLYPNPVQGSCIALQMGKLPPGFYWIKVYNSNGQLIESQFIGYREGSANETLSVNRYKPGVYILEISGPVKWQKKFVIR